MPISSSDLAARQFRLTIGMPACDSALKRPEIGPFGKVGTGLSVKSELATHFRRFSGRHQPHGAAFSPDRDNNSGTSTRAPRKYRKHRFSGRSSRYVVRLARYIPAPSRTGNYCRVTGRGKHPHCHSGSHAGVRHGSWKPIHTIRDKSRWKWRSDAGFERWQLLSQK